MQKEAGLSGESLPEEMKLYFREIFDVLRCQGFYLRLKYDVGDFLFPIPQDLLDEFRQI